MEIWAVLGLLIVIFAGLHVYYVHTGALPILWFGVGLVLVATIYFWWRARFYSRVSGGSQDPPEFFFIHKSTIF